MSQDRSARSGGKLGASALGASTLWIVLLIGASTALTAWLHCLTPFSALAALAAVHMRRADGLALIIAAWAVGQATGYLMLDYPTDPRTIAWGFGIGAAAVASVVAAGAVAARVGGYAARLAAAFAGGFVAFKTVLLLCSFGLGGTAVSASPSIAAQQLLIEVPTLLALLAAYRLLSPSVFLPRLLHAGWPPPDPMLRRVADRAAVVACNSCRDGARLVMALRAVAAEPGYDKVAIEDMACLFACAAPCAVYLRAPGKIGYVLGSFAPDAGAARAILDYAAHYAASAEGEVDYADWPEGVKGRFLARTPPPGYLIG